MSRCTLLDPERLAALRAFHREHGRLPSARELLSLFRLASPRSATRFYHALVEAGLAHHDRRRYRPTLLLTGIKYYESVSAGFPSPAEDETADLISLDEYLFANRESSFLVKVSGDSMTGAGIMPGDLVVVERGARPRPGDIVVARIGTEWTLKQYLPRGRQVVLRAANPAYPDLAPKHEEVEIGGVVRASLRRYGR